MKILNRSKRRKIYPMDDLRLAVKMGLFIPRAISKNYRSLPDFLIIGAQKAGTSSLYFNLRKHEQVFPSFTKEVHFFDNNYKRGADWYRAHFPFKSFKDQYLRTKHKKVVCGEASPAYLYHPLVPKRVFDLVPDVRLIAILRNPIGRAFSHYQHNVRLGFEDLTFAEALDREEERLQGEREKIERDEYFFSFNFLNYSYKARGIYIEQLNNWLNYFPIEQMLIIKSDDFYQDPGRTYKSMIDFLGLDPGQLPEFKKYNVGKYSNMDKDVRKKMSNFFKPYNLRLYELIKKDYLWD